MRILVLTNMYPPHHLGGYEQSCRDVMHLLRARGHDITVLTTTMRVAGVDDPPDERPSGVRRDLNFYWDDHVLTNPPIPRRLMMERANHRALADALTEVHPQVVSVWNMGAMSLGLLTHIVERDIPLVLSVCDEWPIYGPHLDAWTRLFRGRPLLARAVRRLTGVPTTVADLGRHATFLFISDMIRARVEERSAWHPSIASVVYNGIDHTDFAPVTEPSMDTTWHWRLLYVGRIDERKGIHVAVNALTDLPPEASLDIDGRGDTAYEARLRDLTRSLGLEGRVRFAVTPRESLADRYRNADVVVFPTTWEEPFGLVPLEAMACGTPVVATGTGGSGEFLRDGGNCLLVPPGDAGALARAVRRLAEDPGLRSQVVSGGVRTSAELSIGRLADIMEEWHIAAAERFERGRPVDRRPAVV
jgi:glycosyltransferase involved in cell wall biosynthesis